MPAKGGYNRIVCFGFRTGWVLDVGGHQAMAAQTPTTSEETFTTGEGTNRVIARGQAFGVPLIRRDHIDHVASMRDTACEVGLVALGFKRHRVWLAPSQLEIAEASGGFGSCDGRVFLLNQSSTCPAISGSGNLLAFAPWFCTEAEAMTPGTSGNETP